MFKRAEGKFLISSYSSDILSHYTKSCRSYIINIEKRISVANTISKGCKKKIEVLIVTNMICFKFKPY
ncbi:hypothetical protein SAMN05444275_10394 [Myroides odoratimimus subsp. xuanwuensis]|nr:hypothetical protein SAMN05444275_10394 [Myroides odoratimimus subsp. xuanwuensis]